MRISHNRTVIGEYVLNHTHTIHTHFRPVVSNNVPFHVVRALVDTNGVNFIQIRKSLSLRNIVRVRLVIRPVVK